LFLVPSITIVVNQHHLVGDVAFIIHEVRFLDCPLFTGFSLVVEAILFGSYLGFEIAETCSEELDGDKVIAHVVEVDEPMKEEKQSECGGMSVAKCETFRLKWRLG
jgi:hypothetical protein